MGKHTFVFLPGQHISPAHQLRFARLFGAIAPPHPVFPNVKECPEVTVIEQKGESGIYNDEWHTDVTFRETPAMASVLYSRIIPPVGGDTLWSSLYAAYDTLSAPIKKLVEGLSAVHDITMGFGNIVSSRDGLAKLRAMQEKFPPVVHPVVRTHPETGRHALFVNRSFTAQLLGLSKIEARHLLDMLIEHAEQSSFQMRYRWQPDTIAMWDNRCTMHYAAADVAPHHRLRHRVTVVGDSPYLPA